MGERLSTQLEVLRRERERLEELLMLDANWRALRRLDEIKAAGETSQSADDAGLRAHLLAALSGNRLFAARAKLIETIDLLSAAPPIGDGPWTRTIGMLGGSQPVSSRIVLLNQPGSESFRARVRMKATEFGEAEANIAASEGPPEASLEPTSPPASSAAQPPHAVPDALELIDGLGRHAVEIMLAHGIRSYAEIAAWSPADAAVWRARLDGLADDRPSGWIEQAAILAAGRETSYAARVRRGEFACLVPMPEPEPPRRQVSPPDAPPPVHAVMATSHLSDAIAQVEVERRPLLSRLSLRRRGFARPAEPLANGPAPADLEMGEEVVIRHRPVTDEELASNSAASSPHPNRLVRRLKQLEMEERFSADRYAAYRSEIEEASVTIISTQSGPAPAGRTNQRATDDGKAPDRTVSRFLRALTGRS